MDRESSFELSTRIKTEGQVCHLGAFCAQQPGVTYVEGFWVGSALCLPFEHAWIERDGIVIDPMLPDCDPSGTETWTYFEAFRWSREELISLQRAHKGKLLSPLQRYMRHHGKDQQCWVDAALLAHRHCAALHEDQTGTPLYLHSQEHEMLRGIVGDDWIERMQP